MPSTPLGREFGVIFPHYFSSSSAGDCAPLEYPIWLLLQYAKMNCLWRKITPLLNLVFFFLMVLISLGWKSQAVTEYPWGRMLTSIISSLFFSSFVVIECSFIILFIFYFWNRNENTPWCKSLCYSAYFINSTFCCFNIHF